MPRWKGRGGWALGLCLLTVLAGAGVLAQEDDDVSIIGSSLPSLDSRRALRGLGRCSLDPSRAGAFPCRLQWMSLGVGWSHCLRKG